MPCAHSLLQSSCCIECFVAGGLHCFGLMLLINLHHSWHYLSLKNWNPGYKLEPWLAGKIFVSFLLIVLLLDAQIVCSLHESVQESVLKFPNVLCGSPEHITMQSVGISLMASCRKRTRRCFCRVCQQASKPADLPRTPSC